MGGSCPCPRRFIWSWSSKGGLPDAPSAEGTGPPPSRKFPFAQGKAPEGPGAGGGVHGVAVDHRINPARKGGGREASRGWTWGWKGMRPEGGGQAGVRVWGLTLPRTTPTAACKGPRRPGKRGESSAPSPPAFSGFSGRILGEVSRGFCRPGRRKGPFCAARAAPKTPVAASVRASVG